MSLFRKGDYILDNSKSKRQSGLDRPVRKKASYLLAFFARFFLDFFGVNGLGGVLNIRRSTSSSGGFFAMVGG